MMFVALFFTSSLAPLCNGTTGITRCCLTEEVGESAVSDADDLRCSLYHSNRRHKVERQ